MFGEIGPIGNKEKFQVSQELNFSHYTQQEIGPNFSRAFRIQIYAIFPGSMFYHM